MARLFTYCFLITTLCFGYSTKAQFLCDYEYSVINKQKNVVKKKALANANLWLLDNADELNLPLKLKLSKIQIKTNEGQDEVKKWDSIDSLLCLNKGSEVIDQAMNKMYKMKLAVYDIRTYFNFANTNNPEIRSILYFQFDINGNLLAAIIRKKENSPYSEKYYH